MSGREGVLGEPLIEMLDEPPIGNEACPQTSANPDAVVLGGIPLDDETLAPGERAGTGSPSASSTHDPPSLNSDMEGFRNFMTQDTTTDEEVWRQWAMLSQSEKVSAALTLITDVAVGVRLVHDSNRLFWLFMAYVLWQYELNDRYILPWLRRKYMELAMEHWRLSGEDAYVVSYQPRSCAVNIFGFSPTWEQYTRMLERETDPRLISYFTKARSYDLSTADTSCITVRLLSFLVDWGAFYYVISGRGRVLGILYLVYFAVFECFCSKYIDVTLPNILMLHVRIRRHRGAYSQAGLDPL
jgi:hypothetical protein